MNPQETTSQPVPDIFTAYDTLSQKPHIETTELPIYRGNVIQADAPAIASEYVHGDTVISPIAAVRTGQRHNMESRQSGDVFHVARITSGKKAAEFVLMHVEPDNQHPAFVGKITDEQPLSVGYRNGATSVYTSDLHFDIKRTASGAIHVIGRSKNGTEVATANAASQVIEPAQVATTGVLGVIADMRRPKRNNRQAQYSRRSHQIITR